MDVLVGLSGTSQATRIGIKTSYVICGNWEMRYSSQILHARTSHFAVPVVLVDS